jgi:hypothetical protein
VGRWAPASDRHSQNSLQTLFFLLPSFGETMTELELHTEGLTETVLLHLDLGYFVLCCLCFLFFPLWWDNRTASETPSSGLEADGLIPKLLRLKLYCIWTWGFLFLLVLSFLCLSNACLVYCWLVHYLFLFISLALVFVFFFFSCLFFPFSLPSLLSLSSHPSILDITIVIITS